MRGGPTETGSIIWWRVQRSQANCIKFVGCGADSTLVDESSANPEVIQDWPSKLAHTNHLEKPGLSLYRIAPVASRSEACQGDTSCLSVSNICLNIPAHVLRPLVTAALNTAPAKTYLRLGNNIPFLCRYAIGRTIAPDSTGLEWSFAHIACGRHSKGPANVPIVGAIDLGS